MNEIIYRISTCVSMPPHGFIVTVGHWRAPDTGTCDHASSPNLRLLPKRRQRYLGREIT
jgi:hypothetical protein